MRIENDGIISADEVRIKQREYCIELFKKKLFDILDLKAPHLPQSQDGSYHFKKDIVPATSFTSEDNIFIDQLVRLVRATHW